MSLKIRTTRVACPTTTGNQDITISGFGVPKAALFILGSGTADGVAANHSNTTIGCAVDATHRWCNSFTDEHGLASSDVYIGRTAAACVNIISPLDGTVDGVADFVEWISDGVRINWSNAPAAAHLMTVVLFGGTDLQAYAGTFVMSNVSNGVTTVSGLGFRPTDIIVSKVHSFSTTRSTTIGMAHNDGTTTTQGFTGIYRGDGKTPSNPASRMSTQYSVGGFGGNGGDSTVAYGEVGGFGVDGFTVTTRNSTGMSEGDAYYLALRIDNYASWKGTITTPTATGNQAITAPGFKPQFMLQIMGNMEAVETGYTDNRAGSIGISVADASAQYSNTWASEDNLATTNTESLTEDQLAVLHNHDGTEMLTASLSSFDASGWTANYSSVAATGKLWHVLAIQEEGGSGPITGGLSQTLGALTSSATGSVHVQGTVSATLGALTASARGATSPLIEYVDGPGGDVNSAEDNNLFGSAPNANLGLHASCGIETTEHFVMRFDMSGVTGMLHKATLYLTMENDPIGNATVQCPIYSISQANADWVAGVSEGQALAGESCWNAKAADGSGGVTTPWAGSAGCSTPGTDYEPTPIGTVILNTGDPQFTTYEVELDVDRLSGWRGQTNTNYGIIVLPQGGTQRHWSTAESGNAAYRPRLVALISEPVIHGNLDATLGGLTLSAAGTVAPTSSALEISSAAHAQAVDAPALTSIQALAVLDSTQASAADAVLVVQAHSAVVEQSTLGHSADPMAVVQAQHASVADASSTHLSDAVSAAQAQHLIVEAADHPSAAEVPALAQLQLLAATSIDHDHITDVAALTQVQQLLTQASFHVESVGTLLLGQAHVLGILGATISHSVDAPSFAASSVLSISQAAHGHQAELLAVGQGHVLSIQEAGSDHTAGSIVPTQHQVISIASASHQAAADSVHILAEGELFFADAAHAHSADSIQLHQAQLQQLQQAVHTHAAGTAALSQEHVLVVSSAAHLQASDEVSILAEGQLAFADATHAHSADNPAVVQRHVLAISAAQHAHAAEQPSIGAAFVFSISSTISSQQADVVAVGQKHILQAASATHAETAGTPATTQAQKIQITASRHDHVPLSPTIVQAHAIVVQGAVSGQDADEVLMAASTFLAISDAYLGHTSDAPGLYQPQALLIAGTLHAHAAGDLKFFRQNRGAFVPSFRGAF